VGAAAARDLARHCGSLPALAELGRRKEGTDAPIPGVGAAATRSVRTYFRQSENQTLVAELLAFGVQPASPQE